MIWQVVFISGFLVIIRPKWFDLRGLLGGREVPRSAGPALTGDSATDRHGCARTNNRVFAAPGLGL